MFSQIYSQLTGYSLLLLLSVYSLSVFAEPHSVEVKVSHPALQVIAENKLREARETLEQGFPSSRPQAIAKYLEALQMWQNSGNTAMQAQTLEELANVHNLFNKFQAIEYYRQALRLYRLVGNSEAQAQTLHQIALLHNTLGEQQKALEALSLSRNLYRQLGNSQGEADVLFSFAWLHHRSLGNKARSVYYYNNAMSLYGREDNRSGVASTLKGIGGVYKDAGQDYKAEVLILQALAIYQEVGDKSGEAKTLIELSQMYVHTQKKKEAISALDKALQIWREINDLPGEAKTFQSYGDAYWSFGELEKALSSYRQSLVLWQEIGDHLEEGNLLQQMGLLFATLGDETQAIQSLQHSVSIRRRVGERSQEANTLYHLALLEQKQGNLQNALRRIQTAIEITNSIRNQILSQELRTSYVATVHKYNELYIDLLMQLHQQFPQAGYEINALYVNEHSRARTLLERLSEAKANLRQTANLELLQQSDRIQTQLNELEQRRFQLVNRRHTPEQVEKLEQELSEQLVQYQDIQDQIRLTNPRYAAITQPQPLTLQQIQSQLLDEDTLLLKYFLGEQRSYLWAVTKTEVNSYILPSKSEIEATVRQFEREELVPIPQRRSQKTPAVETLSQILLAPVSEHLGSKRLAIVGDGILHAMPFGALLLPQPEGQPEKRLVDNHEIVHLPSASTLAILRQENSNRQNASRVITIFADPVFSTEDERVSGVNSRPRRFPQFLDNIPITEAQPKKSQRNFNLQLARLPGTRMEAEAIMALVPETQRTQILDFDANRAAASHPNLAQYRIVHFATHGIFNSAQPEFSGIVLSLVDAQGNPQNGFLALNDIFNLNLSADLVVLSACQTGRGTEVQGEGVIGLTRGFMYAGAPRVIVSLWKVDDLATAELMKRFYTHLLQEGLTPASALRAAQVEMSQHPLWHAPYYWAGFVLQGEWK